jgi:methylated-DNA-protein-cysteine methyltransferase-like protein
VAGQTPPPSPWAAQVYAAVRLIPRGRVSAYVDVATFLGHPLRARQVGSALGALPEGTSPPVPWHRVVNAAGFLSIRGAFMGKDRQRALLRAEGVDVDDGYNVVGFAAAAGPAKPGRGTRRGAAAAEVPGVRFRFPPPSV